MAIKLPTITIKEMAIELGVSPRTISRAIKSKKLIIKRISTRLFSRKDFELYKANF